MSWIMTYTGKKVDFVNPDIRQLYDMKDVSHALSRIERFTGHGSQEYTVGLHTLIGTSYMMETGTYSDREIFLFFIHDFPEYVLNDVSSPLKRLLPEYIKIEKKFEGLLYEAFEIDPITPEEKKVVKLIDMMMLGNEARAFVKYPEEFECELDYRINFDKYLPINKPDVAQLIRQHYLHLRSRL